MSVSANERPVMTNENPCFRSPPPAWAPGPAWTPAPGSQGHQAPGRTSSSTQVSLTCATSRPTAWTMTGWTPLTGFSPARVPRDTCSTRALQLEILEVETDMEKLKTVRNNKPSIWKIQTS